MSIPYTSNDTSVPSIRPCVYFIRMTQAIGVGFRKSIRWIPAIRLGFLSQLLLLFFYIGTTNLNEKGGISNEGQGSPPYRRSIFVFFSGPFLLLFGIEECCWKRGKKRGRSCGTTPIFLTGRTVIMTDHVSLHFSSITQWPMTDATLINSSLPILWHCFFFFTQKSHHVHIGRLSTSRFDLNSPYRRRPYVCVSSC